ncbi:MAG TPA: UDP-N-acetyl-D-glucosamine dehydrogenase, partial [Bacteroidetes bacterium]|nr:UDP-N-acetyl-D-glucosamine dehydrogenase [Bacteroidota bacterium]
MKLFEPNQSANLSDVGTALAEKINAKTAVIGIVGLGYVGLPIGLEYAKKGFTVLGVDVSEEKVDMLNRGENYNEDLADAAIAEAAEKGLLSATTDFARLGEADVIFIAVPTPFNENKDPDLGFVLSAGRSVGKTLRKGQLIILKSTTFPGTTEDYLVPILEESGLETGVDYFVAFSPERVDPGNKVYHT